jgi:hypothetical protein
MSIKREYKTAQEVRTWLRFQWIPSFGGHVFSEKNGVAMLESSISDSPRKSVRSNYEAECCIACFLRMSKVRRLDMCRRVLKEMGRRED